MDPDSGSGAFFTPRSGKKSGSGSGTNNLDHISESLETIFWTKILKFFDSDPGLGIEKILTRDSGWKKFGSGIPDPQHCFPGDRAAAEPVPAAGGRGLCRLVHGPAPPTTPHPRPRPSQQVRQLEPVFRIRVPVFFYPGIRDG